SLGPNGSDASDVNSDFAPGLADRNLFGTGWPIQTGRHSNCRICKILKLRRGPGILGESLIPDVARGFPGIASDLDCCKIESMVGNSRIDVYASVVAETVIGEVFVVLHIGRLWILAYQVIVIRRARSFHRT